MRADSDRLGRERAVKVKEAMQHAWRGYEQYAWGADELAPRGKKAKQNWGGMGVTLVDSLGTWCGVHLRCSCVASALHFAAPRGSRVMCLVVWRLWGHRGSSVGLIFDRVD